MRLVRVERRGAVGEELDLHPQLTVVRGLSGDARHWVVETLGRLGGEGLADAGGEIESSGVVMPLDRGSLELLGLTEPVDCVVDSRRLFPAKDSRPADDSPGLQAGEGPSAAGADEELLDPVDSWFSDDDGSRADEVLRGDDAAGAGRSPVAPEPELTALEHRIAALRERRDELSELASAIAGVDVAPVVEALEGLETAPEGVPVAEAAELADAWRDLQKELQGLELGTGPEERAALVAVGEARKAVAEAEAVLRQPLLTEEQMARIEATHNAYIEASDRVERRFGGGRARKQLAEAEAEEARLLGRFGFESWVDFMLTASKRNEDPERLEDHAALEAAQLELEICIGELDAIPGAVGRRHRRTRLRDRQEALSERIARVLGHQPVGDDVEADLRNIRAPYVPTTEVRALADALERAGVDVARFRRDAERLTESARRLVAAQAQSGRRRADLTVAVEALDEALTVLEAAVADGETEVPPMPALPDMAEPPVDLVNLADDVVLPVEQRATPDAADLRAAGADGRTGEDDAGGNRGDDDGDQDAVEGAEGAEGAEDVEGGDESSSGEPGDDRGEELAEDGAEPSAIPRLFDVETAMGPPAEAEIASRTGSEGAALIDDRDRAALVDDLHWEAMVAVAGALSDGPAGQLPVVFDDPFTALAADDCVEIMSRLVRLTDQVQMIVVTDRLEVAEWAAAIGSEHASVLERSP